MNPAALYRRRRREVATAGAAATFLTDPSLTLFYEAGQAAGAQSGSPTVGPAYTRGSTTGADTNDPTYVSGPPSYESLGVDDNIVWPGGTAAIDAAYTNAAGFWVMVMPNFAVGDIGAFRCLLTKGFASAGNYTSYIAKTSGNQIRLVVWYGGVNTASTTYLSTPTVTSGVNYVIWAHYDPTAARASRCRMWINGSEVAVTNANTLGSDGSVASGAAGPLSLGYESSLIIAQGPSQMAGGALGTLATPTTLADNVATWEAFVRARNAGWT